MQRSTEDDEEVSIAIANGGDKSHNSSCAEVDRMVEVLTAAIPSLSN